MIRFKIITMVCFCVGLSGFVRPTEAFSAEPDWSVPTADAVHRLAVDWAAGRNAGPEARRQIKQIWQDTSAMTTAEYRLSALATSFAAVDSRAEKLVQFCAKPREGITLPNVQWLLEADADPLMSANLRLVVARWLIGESLYDEALVQLDGLQPKQVVDPASLLFCQAVVHHRLLQKDASLDAIDQLLVDEKRSPRRYVALARLMQQDIRDVSEDTLDHIARRMEDIERRLSLGRGGPRVREVEDGVIESLDKLIKKLEEQQQGGQGSGNNLQPSRPADDSRLMGGKGPGRVTKKPLGNKTGWGDLPPKQREEALQEIGRQFPSHYRDVIEQYFRKMAGEKPAAK